MKRANIVLPVDLEKCALDAFSVVNRCASWRTGATVTLLHVVNLNILAPENRLYDEISASARQSLERVAREYVSPGVDVRVRVRTGNLVPEIINEARERDASLLVLPVFPLPRWKAFFAAMRPAVVEKLARSASCPIFVVRATTWVNCTGRSDSEPTIRRSPAPVAPESRDLEPVSVAA